MPARHVTSLLVRLPAPLKRRLAREVARRGVALNDVAGELLAGRFGVAFRPSGRKGSPPGDARTVLLRVPAELKQRIQAAARDRGTTANQVVVESLAESLTDRKDTMTSTNGSTNGRARSTEKVRVALVGVGNCANSLLQGVEYYKDAPDDKFVPGLMHVNLGGYHVRDIEFTAAFDVTTEKVGKDLSQAIWAKPNDTYKFADVPKLGIKVSRGMTHDGLGKYLSEVITKAPGPTADITGILRDREVDVM